ncbi:MAG TPA: hypothetical protein VHS53_15525 [Mucilaginibacter sp.]|nr:hypothetical protein [Mucilaginibacter sp.]
MKKVILQNAGSNIRWFAQKLSVMFIPLIDINKAGLRLIVRTIVRAFNHILPFIGYSNDRSCPAIFAGKARKRIRYSDITSH